MPDLSALAPIELFELSADPSAAEVIFDALRANLNGRADNFGEGGYTEAKLVAMALGLARLQQGARRLEQQIDPATAFEAVGALEAAYGLTPLPGATLAERQAALALAMRDAVAGTFGNVSQALVDRLGEAFVTLRPITDAESVRWPVSPGDGPGNFSGPDVPRFLGKITTPIVTSLGYSHTVAYAALDGSAPAERIRAGMRLVIEPEVNGNTETVLVTAANTSGPYLLSAVFSKAHAGGCIVTSQPYPLWVSTKLFSFVVLTAAGAADAATRRAAHAVMARMAEGFATWSVVGSAGPFTLNDPALGILDSTPIGALLDGTL